MGDTCTLVADLCQCMANRPQYCKVNSLQLNKLIKKKKRSSSRRALEKLLESPVTEMGLIQPQANFVSLCISIVNSASTYEAQRKLSLLNISYHF